MRLCRRVPRKLFLAAVPVISGLLCAPDALAQQATPINLPPLNGFQPLVVFGLSDEQVGGTTFDTNDFAAQTSDAPGSNGVSSHTLPVGGAQKFFVAVVDTGSQSCILSVDTAAQIDLGSANRLGANPQEIIGASGSETTDITDPIGIYMTDLNHGVSSTGSSISVSAGTTFKGMWNTSVLTTRTGSVLPNLVGSPLIGLYQVQIKSSQPTHVTLGSTTYKSPQVTMAATNAAIPSTYGKVTLQVTNNVGGPPVFIPSLANFDNDGDDPAAPTVWESLFANVNMSHTGDDHTLRSTTGSFLFDTGAQVSVLSSGTAGDLGIRTAGETPTKPDFFTEITGVGGSIEEVPGFYIDSLTLSSTGDPLAFTHAPVIVLDLPDPRNPNQTLPGILGTNLFTAHDITINIDTKGTGKTGLYVSPEWSWKFNGSGNWSDSTKWRLVLPNGVDTQANFFGAITTPQTVTVDGAFTVGSISFDNANRYTLNGAQTVTLDVSTDDAQINVNNGSHTINSPLTLNDTTELNVLPAASVLTINGNLTTAAGVGIIKGGAGTAEVKNIRAASLSVDAGRLTILQNGSTAGTSRVSALSVADGGKLDLKDNDLIVHGGTLGTRGSANTYSGITGLLQSGRNGGDWSGSGIVTSMTAATNGILTSLGVATAQQAKNLASTGATSTWSGQTVTGSDVLVMYTYGGDANLDGKIDISDYGRIDFNIPLGTSGWFNGDFNYDGKIDISDYGIIDFNVGIQGASLLSGAASGDPGTLAIAVPEPLGGAIVMLLGVPMLARRRRGHRRAR